MSAAAVGSSDQAARLRALAAATRSDPAEPAHAAGRGVVVTVCSGKGGVGKTTFAVNAAVILARLGVHTVLVDLDIGVANADLLLGVSPPARLTRLALADGRLTGAASPIMPGFSLVAGIAGGSTAARLTGTELDGALVGLDRLRHAADLVLVDTGAGVGVESMTLAAAADLTIYVTTPEPTSIADAYAAHKCVSVSCGGAALGPACGLVVNAALDRREAARAADRLDATSRRFLGRSLPGFGWIRRDRRMARAGRSRVPVTVSAPMCRVSRDLSRCVEAVWSVCASIRAEEWSEGTKVAGRS